jgi:CHAT domain-containing protein
VDESVPYLQQAALVLSNPELTGEPVGTTKGGVDGYLTMSEVMGLKMPTELVATIACETGLGSAVGGEGVMNLGRAFQYAGARSVLTSLWGVEDESSNILGERLFAGMKQGRDKDVSLLEARRTLRDKGYEHPFYWAPFILVGERDVVQQPPGVWLYWLVGGGVAALAVGAWLLLRTRRTR